MLSKIAKVLLVSTSFSPVLLTYSFVLWLENKPWMNIISPLIITIGLLVICMCLLKFAGENIQIIDFNINSIKTADGEVVGFLVAYLLPFVNFASNEINKKVLIFIFILFFIVVWGTNSYHINPLITLLGYHFYEVTTSNNITFLLLTKKDLRNTTSIKKVVQLTEYMVLDTRR
ncbi:hypothetical protein [uncultured Clostridium sp.]|uniref:hypothetical protein n=1 Tax=uncultured Clostridium sp. TaxID=59620 RepID=UPI0028E73AF4|nr:hypothetical protein [uncultured Clostridium sp.]